MAHTKEEKLAAFGRLLDVMDDLREKCPWDHKQTFQSLRENTIEEAYELTSAIMSEDMKEVSKELGDVLLHIVFYAKMGDEIGQFDMADVCNRLCDKLIFRHPHVYGVETAAKYGDLQIPDASSMSPDEVIKLWEKVKTKEKDGNKTLLSGVPASLPTLVKAYRIQEKVANVGFDWAKREDVWEKVKEEVGELEVELRHCETIDDTTSEAEKTRIRTKAEGELGDLLFALINMARLYKLRPDNALERTNQKFTRRFNYVEAEAKKQGHTLTDMTLDEMESLWQQAKLSESVE